MLEITMKTNESITFEEGCNLYLQNCRERNLREDTIRHYRQSYLRFYKHFDRDMPISEMNERKYDLPLSAGLGVDAFDDASSEDFETTNPKCDFALRVKGDSMEPDIPDGSIVLIHKQDSVDMGEVGAFFYNGRLYCKKRSIEDGKILLLSNNEKYEPIEIENEEVIACYGKVIEIVKE